MSRLYILSDIFSPLDSNDSVPRDLVLSRRRVSAMALGSRARLDCRQLELRQAVRRVSTRSFDTRSKASIELVASAIKPGRQSLK